MICKHCLMSNLLIGMHTRTFNDTIICFYTELLTHSLHNLNVKADEINSQTECNVSIPELLRSWFCNLNNIIAMHFTWLQSIFTWIYSMFHQVKKINLSKIKPEKDERSPTEVTGTEYEYWRREFNSLKMSYLSCSLLQYLFSLQLEVWFCYRYIALCIHNTATRWSYYTYT